MTDPTRARCEDEAKAREIVSGVIFVGHADGRQQAWAKEQIVKALAAARESEREECAKVAEMWDLGTLEGHAIARAIRARGGAK